MKKCKLLLFLLAMYQIKNTSLCQVSLTIDFKNYKDAHEEILRNVRHVTDLLQKRQLLFIKVLNVYKELYVKRMSNK
jgi:hypothetical protein